MEFRHAREILEYWDECPPEHEMLALLARVYTTWEPKLKHPKTEEEVEREHRASLERRWKSGQAMSAAQMVQAFGGAGKLSIGKDGVFRTADGRPVPGARPFPGMSESPHA
jgi:hypothetical protein